MGKGETGRGFPSLSFSPSLPFSLSLFRRSLRSFSFSPLSNNDNDHSSSRALCVHRRLWLARVSECLYFGSFPVWPNMFVSYNCASLVPLGMKWACICAGNGWCVCVWLCEHVLVCVVCVVLSSLCCWLPPMRWLLVWWWRFKKDQNETYFHCGFN